MKNLDKEKMMKKFEEVKAQVAKKRVQLEVAGLTALTSMNMAYADAADDKWNSMINFMLPWIQRIGGVVMLIGAIEFGLGWKNDDAEGKVKGMRTAVAGAIVIAVGVGSGTFLMP